jgi:hypothetical protein
VPLVEPCLDCVKWFWSFREAVAGSLSNARIAVSSGKVAMGVAGEIGRSAVYMR